MATTTTAKPKSKFRTLADARERVGHLPGSRVLTYPAAGTATTADLLDRNINGDWPTELVDGILVRKELSRHLDGICIRIASGFLNHTREFRLGFAATSQGFFQLRHGLVRAPDVSFIRWDRVGSRGAAFFEAAPDLAVEVLSPSNTRKEMEIKLEEYAKAGVKLVWYVDPERKEVDVFPKGNAKRKKTFTLADTLDGGDLLPGFTLPVAKIFENPAPAIPGKKKPNGKR